MRFSRTKTTQPQLQSPPELDAWQGSLRKPIPALDGVRGLAILAVLFHQLLIETTDTSHWLALLLVVPDTGWVGVQLFFVLSGFLITGILLETRTAKNRWTSFFVRRALRIFPPYYLLLFVLFCVLPLLMHLPPDLSVGFGHQFWYWFYLSNWADLAGSGGIKLLGHCWSLAVEEQFYLLWPPVVFAIRRCSLVWLCVLAIVVALATRTWIVLSGKNLGYAYELTVSRMDALAMGALTAILVRHRESVVVLLPRLSRWSWLIFALLAAVGLAGHGLARLHPVTMTLGHTVLALASACLILVAVRDNARGFGWVGRLLAWAPLRLFGKHSYAIYLFHQPINKTLQRLYLVPAVSHLEPRRYLCAQGAYIILGSAFLLGVAVIFHVAFERPILNLKRYFVAEKPAA